MSIPPTNIGTIANPIWVCPAGYALNNTTGDCDPVANVSTPPISVTTTGLADQETDPSIYAAKFMSGIPGTGIIERFVTALIVGIANLAGPIIATAASLFDTFLAALGTFFEYAQGQRTQGYYLFIASLMQDLTGIEVDGNQLWQDFQSGGRVNSMAAFGASFINAMASEMAGVTQVNAGNAWAVSPGSGEGGLPAITLSEAQGMNAVRAMFGFGTAFAVREGNTDMLADYIPYGLGHIFKDFAEDFSKQTGIGRLVRIAAKPVFQILGAVPATWALNVQYRPKLLGPQEAIFGWINGYLTVPQMQLEMQRAGYDDNKIALLTQMHSKTPSLKQLDDLVATGYMQESDRQVWMARSGHTPDVVTIIEAAEDAAILRRESLAAATHFLHEYVAGTIDSGTFQAAISGSGSLGQGRLALTAGEIAGLTSIAGALSGIPRKTLSAGEYKQAYIDGTVTLGEYGDFLTRIGYAQADVTILTIQATIALKKAIAAAEKAGTATSTSPPTSGL